eukprot:2147453-Rhodomonas_salina.1
MAFMVQRPSFKTKVALILYGDQGIGKGIVFDWFSEYILGPWMCQQTDNVKSVMGDHSTILRNKKFC